MYFKILGKWGHVEADGTWSGLVRHAKDEVVDFVICDVFLTYSRSQVKSDKLCWKLFHFIIILNISSTKNVMIILIIMV